jgi:iron-sulfur cluster assembly protein
MGLMDFISSLLGRSKGDKAGAGGAAGTGLSPSAMAGITATHATSTPPRPGQATITLTPRAAEMILSILQQQGMSPATSYVRVAVEVIGPDNFFYKLDIQDDNGEPRDIRCESRGVKVRIDPQSALYCRGTVIDYKRENGQEGFKFANPNAREVSPPRSGPARGSVS